MFSFPGVTEETKENLKILHADTVIPQGRVQISSSCVTLLIWN